MGEMIVFHPDFPSFPERPRTGWMVTALLFLSGLFVWIG